MTARRRALSFSSYPVYNFAMDKHLVVKSNEVIEANYTLSLVEQRVLLMCIGQINSKDKLKKTDEFKLYPSEYMRLCDVTKQAAYRDIKQASEKLFNRVVFIRDKRSGGYLKTRWVYAIRYEDNQGYLTLSFSPAILPYLSEIEGYYTEYNIRNISKMSSLYAIRLYEMVKQWERGWVEISVDDFRKRLCLGNDYSRVYDLKKHVIDSSIKEINSKSDITVSFEQKKTSRRITHFVFKHKLNTANSDKKKNTSIKSLNDRINKFVSENPDRTRGKTRDEVIAMLRDEN